MNTSEKMTFKQSWARLLTPFNALSSCNSRWCCGLLLSHIFQLLGWISPSKVQFLLVCFLIPPSWFHAIFQNSEAIYGADPVFQNDSNSTSAVSFTSSVSVLYFRVVDKNTHWKWNRTCRTLLGMSVWFHNKPENCSLGRISLFLVTFNTFVRESLKNPKQLQNSSSTAHSSSACWDEGYLAVVKANFTPMVILLI